MGVNKVQLANGETIIDISDSTVTPETLAEGVTAHDASGQKITGKMIPGGGSSVQSDWNQTDSSAADFIKNKPFGEVGGDTLTVAIESEDDLANYLIVGEMFVKISDSAPTMADLANGFTLDIMGEITYIPAENVSGAIQELIEGLLFSGAVVFVSEQAVGVDIDGMAFPEVGTYLIIDLVAGFSITIPSYTGYTGVKTLDSKYLPNSVLYTDETYLYKTSDISDASNRITSGELFTYTKENSVIKISVTNGPETGFYFSTSVIFCPGGYGQVGIGYGANATFFYTAEYTP